MTIKSDKWIRRMALKAGMITPFEEGIKRPGIISYGLTSFGYDIRLANEFIEYILPAQTQNHAQNTIDPKNIDAGVKRVTQQTSVFYLRPHGFVLARSVETFRIPRNVSCNVTGKSTYARCGISLVTTPLESEWIGTITLEITNNTELWVKLYAGEGIGQVQFHESNEDCETSYADKAGKYQGQTGVTLPRVD